MFGTCRARFARQTLPTVTSPLAERKVRAADVPLLQTMWETWFADVDLALLPEPSILGWQSPGKGVRSVVLELGGEVVGYLRYEEGNVHEPKFFLARDAQATAAMLAYLNAHASESAADLLLPVHPASRAARSLVEQPFSPELTPWSAAMIRVLDPNSRVANDYVAQVAEGVRQPGLLIWPTAFDV
ncbi:MAG: hypothetical protein ACYC5M_00045 [Anaerolineae bacterium]